MDVKFFDSLFEGDSPDGVKLCMGLTGGDLWPRPAGCHTVYCGQDGQFDYDTIQAVMDTDDADVSIANQALAAGTIWHFIRRLVSGCGLESADSPACVVRIGTDGEMIGLTPNPPGSLTIQKVLGGKLKLRWRYSTIDQEVAPTGFRIYMDSGSGFNFASPDATVAYTSGRADEFDWTSGALANGQRYRFVVRSYRTSAGETQNTDSVFEFADSAGPAAITDMRSEWEVV